MRLAVTPILFYQDHRMELRRFGSQKQVKL